MHVCVPTRAHMHGFCECIFLYVCTYVYAHVHICICRAEASIRCPPQSLFTLESTILAKEPQGSVFLVLEPYYGVPGFFHGCWGSKLGCPCLYVRNFIN